MEIIKSHKSHLKKKFQCLCEGSLDEEQPTLLNDIYTDLYITEGESGKVSDEHEVRKIEPASNPIPCNGIFHPLPEQNKPVRSVLTRGVAGVGKTVTVQKFILDWAEGKTNQDVDFIFPLPFRELNLIEEKPLSMVDLVKHFFTEVKDFSVFSGGKYKVLFILEGLNECRIPLDFHSTTKCCDITEPTTLSSLLANLIKGNLLPSALLWITSRPAAASHIPPECVDKVTELRGFNDPQKEEYVSKKVSDESLANSIITHLKSSRSLYIMCQIPIFCWIATIVLKNKLIQKDRESPKTLTQMYAHFLMIQTHIKQGAEIGREMIFNLGKLAFLQLQRGNLIFYEEDLKECGINITKASMYSGVCTQIFQEEPGLSHGNMFCFVHTSIQEYLAALYVYFTLITHRENALNTSTSTSKPAQLAPPESLYDLHKIAVDLALESKTGHLDLFLRFLLGLSLESNQNLLIDLLPETTSQPQGSEETIQYVKQKIRENPSSEKCINLFHCLNELNDHSLMKEIQNYLSSVESGGLGETSLSSAEWSEVAFILLTSEQQLGEFDLRKYYRSEEGLQGLMPVIKASRSVTLMSCRLTEKSCSILASALSSESSVRELDLSENKRLDSGVTLLSEALGNPLCQLERLELCVCELTDKSCSALASALSSGSSLKQLDLSWNNLPDTGVTFLSAALGNPLCQLEVLKLEYCGLTEESCSSLASVLSTGSSLRQLELSDCLQDSGVSLLSAAIGNPCCQLERLKLEYCGLTEESCSSLASVLSTGSSLRQLELSDCLQDSGVSLLSAAIGNPCCQLERLKLFSCYLTDKGCSSLASALSSGSSLKELNLNCNGVLDSGVTILSAALKNPLCQLERLSLRKCNLTEESCGTLASALSSGSSLRRLDLGGNDLQESDVECLSALERNPQCKLEEIIWRLL
ncbi:NACHT, LRR and PYD domains-containing protein 3-like [Engraulis encrasicolus]|uniref:NACHT, LRR and PYD domains-containing protein 3-like n=1 Tax=Engraulis encrasicolus TaxID=184585 RepID=UPI002FD2E371